MKTVWLIRFAKGKTEKPYYFTQYKGEMAFTSDIMNAMGWATRKEAQADLVGIMADIEESEIKEKLKVDLSIEEHVFGGGIQ